MPTIYEPDTCQCKVEFHDVAGVATYSNNFYRCEEHKALTGQPLLDAVLAHNRSFQPTVANPKKATQKEKDTYRVMVKTEFDRINALGPGVRT